MLLCPKCNRKIDIFQDYYGPWYFCLNCKWSKCPKCGSKNTVFFDDDLFGYWYNCLVCGLTRPAEKIQKEINPELESSGRRKRRPFSQGLKL